MNEEPEHEIVTQSGRTVRFTRRPKFDYDLLLCSAASPNGRGKKIVVSSDGPGRESVLFYPSSGPNAIISSESKSSAPPTKIKWHAKE